MSDLGDEQTEGEIPSFGEACRAQRGTALLRHPVTDELSEVTDAGCARFWAEFEFGKWLLPHIGNSLEIRDPTISELATESFALRFAQGFHHF